MSASFTEPLATPLATEESELRRPAPERGAPTTRAKSAAVELRAQVRGVGMWTPAYADFEAWVAAGMPEELGSQEAGGARPPANLLHPRLRRRTSTLTRAAVTALEAALAEGGAEMAEVRYVLVSSFGEIETTVDLLAQLGDPQGPVSPTKFHNSVHNTATGYMSIASGNHREATALAGGPHNLEIGLLEALAGLAESGGDVVLIFAEERLPPPFDRSDADPTFAVALHLSADRPGPEHPRSLDLELRVTSRPSSGSRLAPAGGLPTMAGPLVQLLRRIADLDGSADAIVLAPGRDPALEAEWTASLHPA
jgi:hypothetical protein